MTMLLFSGIPATGKSTLGRHLATNHGFVYFDMENPKTWPYPNLHSVWDRSRHDFVAELSRLSKRVVLDWGFPPDFLNWVLELKSCGVHLVWFEGDIETARLHFRERNRLHNHTPESNMDLFDRQAEAIRAGGLPGKHEFTVVQAFDDTHRVLAVEEPERLRRSIQYDE